MQNQINEFNEKLVENNIDIGIIEYVKALNKQFYNINIDFIDDFINLVDKDECCIPQEYLVKYGVLTNIDNSYNVNRLIEQNFLEILGSNPMHNVEHRDGSAHKIEYIFSSNIF